MKLFGKTSAKQLLITVCLSAIALIMPSQLLAQAPTFTKEFSPDTIVAEGITTLTFTIDNSAAAVDATGLSFVDILPAGIVIALTPNAGTTCAAGNPLAVGNTIAFVLGTVGAGATCTVSANVTTLPALADGDYVNTSGDLVSSLGNSGTATDTLTVTTPSAPGFSKVFAPDSIAAGATSTLTFTIDNSGNLLDATTLDFTDNLPAGVVVASMPNASTTCTGGTLTAGSGTGVVSYSGGTVAAGASCTVAADVTTTTDGVFVNTSGDLTSSLGNSGTAGDSLTATAPPTPPFSKVFAPDSIAAGSTSTLTFTIDNSGSLLDATTLDFTDNLPAGVVVATPPNASTTCTGGTLTAVSDTAVVSYTGGTVTAGASCTVSADVTSVADDAYVNTSGDLTSSLGNSGTANDTLTVTAPPPPTFAKAFAPGSIPAGDVSTLTFTIDNSGSLLDATTLDFTDNLPAGVIVATTPNASTTCTGGTITAGSGTGVVSYSGGTVAAGASCAVAADVTTTTDGVFVNTSGDLTSSLGNSGTAGDSLTATAPPTPPFSKVFAPDSIAAGSTSTLTFTIDNSGSLLDATTLDFTDNLPAGVVVATPPNASTTCTGGTLTAVSDTAVVSYTGGTVTAGASCTVSADVTSVADDAYVNTSGDLTSSLGNSGTANDTLTVTAPPPPTFAKAFAPGSIPAGDVSTLTFTIDNSGSLLDATTLDFTDNLPAGVIVATTPNASTTCTGGTITAGSGTGVVSYSGGTVAAGASCTVAADVTTTTDGVFVNTSGDLTSSLGNSGTAGDSLTATAPLAPPFSKVFAPDSISAGDVSTLTFSIDNSGSLLDATALDFVDNLPAGMEVANPANEALTCTGGTLTATAGTQVISYSGGSVAASASCSISVDVTGTTDGGLVNTSGDLTSSLGNSGTASDTLTVTAPGAPVFSKAFAPSSIAAGGVSTLTHTIDNSAGGVPANALDFTDNLPAGIEVANPSNAATTCSGGTLTATSGGAVVSYTGGTVPAGGTCTVAVDVTSMTVGSQDSTSGDLTSNLGSSGPASATLTVTDATAPVAAPILDDWGLAILGALLLLVSVGYLRQT